MKKEFIEGKHYYLDTGKVVFTELYNKDRGYCCGNKCRHCPYNPKYIKNNKAINKKVSDIDPL